MIFRTNITDDATYFRENQRWFCRVAQTLGGGTGLCLAWTLSALIAKDFEVLTATTENWIRIAMIKLTLAKCL